MTMLDMSEKTDTELKIDVLSELEYEPGVEVAGIGVLVKDGTVTLNGYAANYSKKWEAVRAVKRVAGVKAIVDDIEIKLLHPVLHTDGDIAAAAVQHIKWSSLIPAESIVVTVREGWITLDGEVEWCYQKNTAENVVRHLSGVKGVSNLISIKPKPTTTAVETTVETAIKSAFKRSALVDAEKIKVEAVGGEVTLRGNVLNFAELEEAERAAWAAPGVFLVNNQLTVKWVLTR
ncbi:MAG: BON domain-containing protein [Coleofasciculaceae cyanobacterium]